MEGIFGAEELENGLKMRSRLRKMQRRLGLAIAIGYNPAVCNRFRSPSQLNIDLRPILPNAEA